MWARSLLCIAATALTMTVLATLNPRHLRTEYLTNPLGIDDPSPRLSWIVESERRGDRQTGYRILVSSSLENLKKRVGDLWDSGEVASDETTGTPYAGSTLRVGQRAW